MGRLEQTFTKTIGLTTNSFGILQVALDTQVDPRYTYKCDEWPLLLGISLSLLQVNHNGTEPTLCVRQYITEQDLDALSMLLWEAKRAYESRKTELQEEERAREAKDKAKADTV